MADNPIADFLTDTLTPLLNVINATGPFKPVVVLAVLAPLTPIIALQWLFNPTSAQSASQVQQARSQQHAETIVADAALPGETSAPGGVVDLAPGETT